MGRAYDDLVREAASVPVDGWDFSWLDGRASEEGPSWGYSRLLGERMATARAALDIQTGGGEILAGLPKLPPVTVATESWPPNLELADARLRPRGARVVADDEEPKLSLRGRGAVRRPLGQVPDRGQAARRPDLDAPGNPARKPS